MKHFFTLVEFEYRKIWKRKSAILAMSVGLLVSILSVWGPLLGSTYINGKVSESNYEATFKDLQYAKDLNGRTLDTELLLEAAHAYAQIPPNTEIPYIGLEEYETYARPYSSIYGIAGRVYRASGEEFSYEEMAALTKRDANHFYEKRASLLKNTIANTTMSQTAKEHTLKTAEKVQTPFTYSNTEGYGRFLTLMQSTGILSAFVIAICLSPLFAGEYTSHADQLLLSSRYGKGKLIRAKLFTGFSFAAGFSLLLLLQTYFQCMLTFGFDGSSTPVQIFDVLCIYPLTLGQAGFLGGLCFFGGCMLMAGLTMLLSAKLKSPFGVMILMSVFLIFPMMVQISQNSISAFRLFHLLPANSMAYFNIFHMIPYEFAGLVVPPYIMFPVFSVVCCAAVLPLAYRGFQRHEIA